MDMSALKPVFKSKLFWPSLAAGAAAIASWTIWRRVKDVDDINISTYKLGSSIHIVDTPEDWEKIHKELLESIQHVKVLGLDCEWVQKRPVALLQLASPTGVCVLVRLFKLGSSIPASLRSLLADKSILKVGVAVTDDGKKLRQDFGLDVSGCVDLRHVLKRVRGVFHCPSRGLRGLAQGVLGVNLNKSVSIRCGNWEAEQYSQAQKEYAATDAAVAVDIFIQLVYAKICGSTYNSVQQCSGPEELSQRSSIPGPSTSGENPHLANGERLSDQAVESCHVNQDDKHANSESTLEQFTAASSDQSSESVAVKQIDRKEYKYKDILVVQHSSNGNISKQQEFWKAARSLCQGIVEVSYNHGGENSSMPAPSRGNKKLKETNSYSTRKRPLWDNCRLEAPDGVMLCTCDTKKAQWYLDKQLACLWQREREEIS